MRSKIELIQFILEVDVDGQWGPKSQAALDALTATVHRGNASSFADPKDVAAFKKWYQIYRDQGLSDNEATHKAFAHGDNGIGAWKDNTTTGLWCALPQRDIIAKWGTLNAGRRAAVKVTIHNQTETLYVGDIMTPDLSSGAVIDLSPDSCALFKLIPPIMVPVEWQWA